MGKFHHNIRRIFACLIGLVFLLSGTFKVMDPTGTSLIVERYLDFLPLGFLMPFSRIIGVAFALFETILGAALLSGIWPAVVSLVTVIVIAFFTLLSVALFIFNPEMDCGCFGEAIHLTHFQTLLKNLVLCALAGASFFPVVDGYAPRKGKYVGFGLVTIVMILFSVYSSRELSIVDFTDLRIGTDLTDPAAPVLSARDAFGDYEETLFLEGEVVAASVYDPEKVAPEAWEQMAQSFEAALQRGLKPVLLVPYLDAVPVTMDEFVRFADRKDILTLNRFNGGATAFSDGLIAVKWAAKDFPSAEDYDNYLANDPLETELKTTARGRVVLEGIIVGSLALLLLL